MFRKTQSIVALTVGATLITLHAEDFIQTSHLLLPEPRYWRIGPAFRYQFDSALEGRRFQCGP